MQPARPPDDTTSLTIFTAFEPSYWRGMICTFSSLLRRTRAPLTIQVLTRREHKPRLVSLMRVLEKTRLSNQNFEIIIMPDQYLAVCDALSMTNHFKSEACFRLFYFDIVRPTTNCLYIDIDLIVQLDISTLHLVVPANAPLRARQAKVSSEILKLHPAMTNYFNSGVLLFNSKYIDEIADRMRCAQELILNLHDKSSFLDQDALNIAFRGRWDALPVGLNYTTTDFEQVESLDGLILHATGTRKPWFFLGGHRYTDAYLEEMRFLKLNFFQRYKFTWIFESAIRRLTRSSLSLRACYKR